MDSANEKEQLLDSDIQSETSSVEYFLSKAQSKARRRIIFLTLALCLSLFLNILVSWRYLSLTLLEVSRYAKLPRNIPVPITFPEIDLRNESANSAWSEIDASFGVIALPDSYSQREGFPRGQDFPWDENKSIYLVNAFHNMHCLQNLRHRFFQWANNETIDEHGFEHALHCLESLRQDVVCNADDLPRYGGYATGESGNGQVRMCRDFGALKEWVKGQTACHHHDEALGVLERYSYCPKGSGYIEKVQEMFPDAVEVDE